MAKSPLFQNVDEYIVTFPEAIQTLLQSVRRTVKTTAPDASESLSYQMPAYRLHGTLVYFGAFQHHIGFYPTTSVIDVAWPELTHYITSKGTLQFRYDQPIPYDLIERVVEFRVKQNLQKAKRKRRRI